MHAIIWEYTVKPELRTAFERAYAANGPWTELFSQSPGFVRTILLAAPNGRYVTIDFWDEAASFDAFVQTFRSRYEAMDVEFSGMTLEENKIGRFDRVADSAFGNRPVH